MKYAPKLYHLSNGMPVILDAMNIATTVVKINFNTGSRAETPENSGITHFVEHMFFAGTPRFPNYNQNMNAIERHGGYINASTGYNDIDLDGRIIAKNLPHLIDTMADALINPLFDTAAIEKEKTVVINEYERRKSETGYGMNLFERHNLFRGDGVKNMTLGHPDTIKSFAREQLIDWKNQKFSTQNGLIAISGKIQNSDKILNQLENLFKDFPSHKVPGGTPHTEFNECIAHNKTTAKITDIAIAFENKFHDSYEYKFQQFCINRFRGAYNDRLYNIIRGEKGLVYGIKSSNKIVGKARANTIGTRISPEKLPEVVSLCAKIAYDMQHKNKFNKAELIQQQNSVLLGDAEWLDSPSQRINTIINYYFDYGILYDYKKVINMGKSIKVRDVHEHTHDIFDMPMSVITHGAMCDPAKLKQIWLDNYR